MNSGLMFMINPTSIGFGMPLIMLLIRFLLTFLENEKMKFFKKLKVLLEPFGIKKFYTDDWGAYERHLDEDKHTVGKKNTQKIERKNLNLRTWIKRLARKTICFSKIEKMHDIVIGLLINKVEFGISIHAI